MTDSKKWFLFVCLLLCAWLIFLLRPILMPFLAAFLFAYLLDPIVDRIEHWRLSRTGAVAIVLSLFALIMLLGILIVLPLLNKQLQSFILWVPSLLNWLIKTALPWLQNKLALSPDWLAVDTLKASLLAHWQQASHVATNVLGVVTRSGFALFYWLANILLIPLVMFYLLRDWDRLLACMEELLPRRWRHRVLHLVGQCDEVLGAFVRGQLLVMLSLGFIYALGLTLVGLNMSLLIGFMAGLLSLVPYLGFLVGIVVASCVALLQFADLGHLIGVAVVFGLGQILESFMLTPMLVGDRIGLHPVTVIFAVLAGGQLFGFMGTLLALPVAAVLLVLLRFSYSHYLQSKLYLGN